MTDRPSASAWDRPTPSAADDEQSLGRLYGSIARDEQTRRIISTMALGASAFLISPWIALVALIADNLFARAVFGAVRRFAHRPNRRDRWIALSSTFLGNLAYITPSLVVIATNQPLDSIFAMFYAMGALLHVTNVLAVHRTSAFVALAAVMVPLAVTHAFVIYSAGDYAMLALVGLAYVLVSLYTVSVVQTNHVLHTELATAKAASEEATAARERMLAVMSHEMRTPLNAVTGISEAMSSEPNRLPDAEHLEILAAAAEDMRGLVDDLVDLAAINAGALRIITEAGNPSSEIRRVVTALQPGAAAKGLNLRLTFAKGVPETAQISPLRLRQSVSNLLSNAIKYTETGFIHVHVSPAARDLLSVRVEDTGPGIPADARARIFENYARLDEATPDKTLGIGLGLPITRELARRMGGDLTVGEAPTGGARFRLTVSAVPCADPVAPEPKPMPPLPEGLRVLVVDDLATNRIVAQLYLSRLGAHMTEAADCAEAMQALHSRPHDAVLLDLRMPGIDGAGTLARIRAANEPWATIPVLAMTADAGEADRRRALATGFDGYVAKPVDSLSLSSALSEALERQRPCFRVSGVG